MLHARVLDGETRDEDGWVAIWVELGVQCAEREDGHLHGFGGVGHGSCAVLKHELRHQAAFDDDVQLCAAGVGVRGVESAGAQEADGHGRVVAD